MKSKLIDEKDESFFKPTSEELDETTEETRKILEKIISSKVFFSIVKKIKYFFRLLLHFLCNMHKKLSLRSMFVILLANNQVLMLEEHNKELFVWSLIK